MTYFAPFVAAAVMVIPTFSLALIFGIAKDGSPFKRSFWGA